MSLSSTRSYSTWTILQSINLRQLSIAQNLICQFNAQRNKLLYTIVLLVFFFGWLNRVVLIFLMKSLFCHDTYYILVLVTLCNRCTCVSICIFTRISIWCLTLQYLNYLTLLQSTAKSGRQIRFILTQSNIFHQIIRHQEENLSKLVVLLTSTKPVIKPCVVLNLVL